MLGSNSIVTTTKIGTKKLRVLLITHPRGRQPASACLPMYSRFFGSPSTDTRKAVFYLDVASARSERHSHGAKTYSTAWKAVKAELILVRHVKTRVLRNRFSRIVCAKNGYFVASVDRIVIAARAG